MATPLADAEGNSWDLNDVFADALQEYPGWRFNAAYAINAKGDIAGVLVPESEPSAGESDETIIVLGNFYTDPNPPTLTQIDHLTTFTFNGIADLNESGDMLVRLRSREDDPVDETTFFLLYHFPDSGTNSPELVPLPADAEHSFPLFGGASVNSNRQVIFTTQFTSTTTTARGRKTTTSETHTYHSYLWDTDGSLIDLGQVGRNGGTTPTLISEARYGYASLPVGGSDSPHQWLPTGEIWEPIAPCGYVTAVSKAGFGEELLIDAGSRLGDPDLVYQRGSGAFAINVTSGFNGQADIERYDAITDPYQRIMKGISRPTASGSGFICGVSVETVDGQIRNNGFILTPIPVEP